jgi:chromosomal replication initiation ATPase DnaA
METITRQQRSKQRYETKVRKNPIVICTEPYTHSEVEKIANYLGEQFNIDPPAIKTRCRSRDYVKPRQILHYMSWLLCGLTLEMIGLETGNYDHTTVINSLEKVNNFIDTDKAYAEEIELYKSELKYILA